jgi:hypothetical protein
MVLSSDFEEAGEAAEETPVVDPAEFKKARTRLLFLWGWAQEAEYYNKKDWKYLDSRLHSTPNPEEVLLLAEQMYELCQDLSWPSQFD